MAFLMPALPIIGTVLGAVGSVMGAVGQQRAGAAQDQAATFRAEQLEYQAGQARASAQRAALEERRQARLAGSRLQALAGGGGLDPTVVGLAGDIAGQGEYRALSALYEGEERALGMEASASAARYEGRQARRAGNIGMVSSLFSAAGKAFGGMASSSAVTSGAGYYADDPTERGRLVY